MSIPKANFATIIDSDHVRASAAADALWRGEVDVVEALKLQDLLRAKIVEIATAHADAGVKALAAQMATLDQAFTSYMLKAAQADKVSDVQRWTNLALKCQESYRRGLLTIDSIKNPKTATFIHQQMNQLKLEQCEVLQKLEAAQNGAVDFGKEATLQRYDQPAKALVEIDRAENGGRQISLFAECAEATD